MSMMEQRALSVITTVWGRMMASVETLGDITMMAVQTLHRAALDVIHGEFPWKEAVLQAWFITSVSLLPCILVTIPIGVTVALQVGGLAGQIGAESMTGASNGVALIQQGAPLVAALLLAGAAGSAICADLGARAVREEVDAMRVMGIDPLRRLVAPRMISMVFVGILLCGVIIFTGVMAGYAFNITVQNGTPGSYMGSLAAFATPNDLIVALVKSAIFGFIAAVVSCHKGMSVFGGPKAVAQAVNSSVVIAIVLLFAVNVVLTQIYVAVFPVRTF
jgi:phospholipid/cholesterol/gamma-HCH transport system permease protein